MSTDRWHRIEELYHAVLKLNPGERSALLEKTCAGDEELRSEVESLLAGDAQAEEFIVSPAPDLAARALADADPSSIVGRKLGPYQVVALLGAGGMGEVYRARDTRLNRTVAIKTLPRDLSERGDLRQRFEREARAIAALNHPNICALHDIGRENGIDFLVMEYLEGQTLSQRLQKGPLPMELVLRYAIEVTRALAHAHRRGVVHRDLKPGNIMLTKAGAKLLDFGLAKRQSAGQVPPDSGAVTESESLTEEGMVLGTVQYMAPEQVEGKDADHRTDIFALGVVIYETATGRKAFEGKTRASLMSAILTAQPPPMTALQPVAPLALERLVKKCLNKDPEERWQSTSDLTTELEWVAEALSQPASPSFTEVQRRTRERLAWVAALILFSTTLWFLARGPFWKPDSAPSVMNLAIARPGKDASWPVISPDGRKLAIYDGSAIRIRPLDSAKSYSLVEVESADPFWSRDSRFVAYWEFNGKKATLKRIEASGGVPQPICETSSDTAIGFEPGSTVGFGTWSQNGVVLFKRGEEPRGISQVSVERGAPLPVTTIDTTREELDHVSPQFLPDGEHFLYYVESPRAEIRGTYVGSLSTRICRRLLNDQAYFAAPGYLLYERDGRQLVQPFDTRRLSLTGDPVPLRSLPETARVTSVSENGILCYVTGLRGDVQVAVFDRSAKRIETIGPSARYHDIDISSDGSKLVLEQVQFGKAEGGLFVLDLRRKVKARLVKGGWTEWNGWARWSPNGSEILFSSDRDHSSGQPDSSYGNLYRQAASGEGQATPLFKSKQIKSLTDVSQNGQFVLYESAMLTSGPELWVLSLSGDRTASLFQGSARDGRFSPDGRWVAYVSPPNWTPAANIFVRSFPSGEHQWQVSSGGADSPRWRGDGKELFYWTRDWKLVSSTITSGSGGLHFNPPTTLLRLPEIPPMRHSYAVSPDGQLFYVLVPDESVGPSQMNVVVNWAADLPKQ